MTFFDKVGFTNKKRTICEVHREMYDLIRPLQEIVKINKLVDLLEEANTMAKKMTDKLYEYHYNVSEHSEENQNYAESVKIRGGNDLHSE
jgi:hypothetical protein